MCTLKIGQKVKCIKKDGWITHNLEDGSACLSKEFLPIFGNIYTIKEIFKMNNEQFENSRVSSKDVFTLKEFGDTMLYTPERFENV